MDTAERVRRSRQAQGFPPTVTEPSALRRLADLVALDGFDEGKKRTPPRNGSVPDRSLSTTASASTPVGAIIPERASL